MVFSNCQRDLFFCPCYVPTYAPGCSGLVRLDERNVASTDVHCVLHGLEARDHAPLDNAGGRDSLFNLQDTFLCISLCVFLLWLVMSSTLMQASQNTVLLRKWRDEPPESGAWETLVTLWNEFIVLFLADSLYTRGFPRGVWLASRCLACLISLLCEQILQILGITLISISSFLLHPRVGGSVGWKTSHLDDRTLGYKRSDKQFLAILYLHDILVQS